MTLRTGLGRAETYWNNEEGVWQQKYVQFRAPVETPDELNTDWNFVTHVLPAGTYYLEVFTRGSNGSAGAAADDVVRVQVPIEGAGRTFCDPVPVAADRQCFLLANPTPNPDTAFASGGARLVSTPRNGGWITTTWTLSMAARGPAFAPVEVDNLTLQLLQPAGEGWTASDRLETCDGEWNAAEKVLRVDKSPGQDLNTLKCTTTLSPGKWRVKGTGTRGDDDTAVEFAQFTVFDPAGPQ